MLKKSMLRLIVLAALFVCLAAPAYAATQPAYIQFNESGLSSDLLPLYIDGNVFIPARLAAECMGADVNWDENTQRLVITKGTSTITMKLGDAYAYKNGDKVELGVPAVVQDGRLLLPLPFFTDALGAKASWDSASSTVIMQFTDTKDGKTVEQLMADCQNAINRYSTYKAGGTIITNMDIFAEGQNRQLSTKMEMEALYRLPQECYVKMIMSLPSGVPVGTPDGVAGQGGEPSDNRDLAKQEVAIETYYNGKTYYQKLPGQTWMALDLPDLTNIMDSFGTTNQNPQELYNSLKKFGFIASFGNDAIKNGNKYTVVCLKIDQEKFRQLMQQVIDQLYKANMEGAANASANSSSTAEGANTVDVQQLQEETKKALEGLNIDVTYKIYYNQKTNISDYLDLTEKMTMKVDQISMDAVVSATMNFYDYGQPVEMPDPSELPKQ